MPGWRNISFAKSATRSFIPRTPVLFDTKCLNDDSIFMVPSEIMDHFGRKGGPQGVEHGENVDDFL